MSQMKKLVLLLLLILTSSACTSRVTESTIMSLSSETQEGLIILQEPRGQREKVFVIDDHICSIYERGKNNYVLEIKSMEDTSYVVNLIPYGSKHGEMLLVDCSASGSKILIRDVVQNTYIVVDIKQVLEDSSHSIEVLPMTLLTQEMVPFGNDKLLYLNQGSFRSKEPRFYIIGAEEQGHMLTQNGRKSLNVLDGTLLYNPTAGKVAFVSMYSPQIELYNAKTKKILSTTSIARSEDAEVVYVDTENISEYLFANKVPLCFLTATSDEDRIVAVYRDEQDFSHILLFDWDGNLQGGFIAGGEVWSVSIYNDYIYCWEKAREHDRLVRYKY